MNIELQYRYAKCSSEKLLKQFSNDKKMFIIDRNLNVRFLFMHSNTFFISDPVKLRGFEYIYIDTNNIRYLYDFIKVNILNDDLVKKSKYITREDVIIDIIGCFCLLYDENRIITHQSLEIYNDIIVTINDSTYSSYRLTDKGLVESIKPKTFPAKSYDYGDIIYIINDIDKSSEAVITILTVSCDFIFQRFTFNTRLEYLDFKLLLNTVDNTDSIEDIYLSLHNDTVIYNDMDFEEKYIN